MDILREYHQNLISQIDNYFFRSLMESIKWNQRMVAIKGPRGSGKTTLMLQYIRYKLKKPADQVLYITADHYWFYTHSIVETAEIFFKQGGRYLFIDEVHKYPQWSRELKNIYDGFPQIQLVFSSSSALDIYRGEADLSRRVITYELPGLSFREYLALSGNANFVALKWEQIIHSPSEITESVLEKLQPLSYFKKYLHWGYLPFFEKGANDELPVRINQMINTVIESDLGFIKDYSSGTAFKVKKLLGVLAESAPFKPNIAALARKLDVSRESIYSWLTHLEKARMLNLLQAKGKGISLLQKPEKVYLENTNLAYALKQSPDIGTIRETFLLNQLINHKMEVSLPLNGDFFTKGVHIEVGGKSKSSKQVKNEYQHIIAADNIERSIGNKIPLWLFGFLY